MYRTSSRALRAIAWIALASAPGIAVAAAADYYLKLGSIEGEAAAGTTGGQVEVQSWSWGASNSGSAGVGGGMGAGKANVQDVTIGKTTAASGPGGGGGGSGGSVKSVDKATPKLAEARVAAGDLDGDGAASDEAGRKMMGAPKIWEATARTATPSAGTGVPADAGSLTVAAALPGCTVGTRYADAELGTPAGRYKFENIMISSCAKDSVTLSYARLRESPTR